MNLEKSTNNTNEEKKERKANLNYEGDDDLKEGTNEENGRWAVVSIDLYDRLKNIEMSNNFVLEKLEELENRISQNLKENQETRSAELMMISRLETISDFLRENHNFVLEENTPFQKYPYDD